MAEIGEIAERPHRIHRFRCREGTARGLSRPGFERRRRIRLFQHCPSESSKRVGTPVGKLAITGGKPVRRKPFTPWPAYGQPEVRGLQKVLASRNWGGYPFPNRIADRFSEKFARLHGAKYGLAVANGTVAIEIALKAIGIQPAEEVIVP
ncbi:MAG: hypothetical protein DMG33_18110, partial [Acidobacteria bacterium]